MDTSENNTKPTIDITALHTLLLENECVITFTKINGEQREMPCTLRPDVVPPPVVHETNTDNPIDFPKVKKANPEVMNVWCLDKKEWRSFRIANVISAKVKND
jgi:hypothetical protein